MLSYKNKLLLLCVLLIGLNIIPAKAQVQIGEEVTLNAVVYDKKKGTLIKDLDSSNFKILNRKTEQKIKSVIQEDVPISVGILVDLSRSIKGAKLDKRKNINLFEDGLVNFIKQSNPLNEYFILGFNEQTKTILDNTQNSDEVLASIKTISALNLEQKTALYDAMHAGIEKVSKSKFKKRILIVFSDGQDSASIKKLNDIEQTLKENSTKVYFVSLFPSKDRLIRSYVTEIIDRFCDISGGWNFVPVKKEQVKLFFDYLAEVLRNQYKITFDLESKKENRKWHELKVKLVGDKNLKNILVRTREGFYVEKEGN